MHTTQVQALQGGFWTSDFSSEPGSHSPFLYNNVLSWIQDQQSSVRTQGTSGSVGRMISSHAIESACAQDSLRLPESMTIIKNRTDNLRFSFPLLVSPISLKAKRFAVWRSIAQTIGVYIFYIL
jgi:hypothetical protein